MLYRALLSTTEHAPGHNPLVWSGEYYVFIENDEESENMPGGEACARFAQHFGVKPSSVTLIDIGCEDELVRLAAGPATDLSWRWFETGHSASQVWYTQPAATLFLVDDERTRQMLVDCQERLIQHLAEVGYEEQRELDMQMDGDCYTYSLGPHVDDAPAATSVVCRTHVRLGGPGRRVRPIAGQLIARVRDRQHRAADAVRVAQAKMQLPPPPPAGRSARTHRARLAWELERERVVFAATFGLAMAAAFAKVPA